MQAGDPERKNEDHCSEGCGITETKGKTDYMDANSSTREKLKTGNYSQGWNSIEYLSSMHKAIDLFVEFCKTEKQNQKKISNCKFPLGLASLYCENIGPNTNQPTEKDGFKKA